MGDEMNYMVGGKGANQAVASARIGAETILIGKVGDDTFGEKLLKHLNSEQVNVESVAVEQNLFSGIASIFKMPSDNAIVVIPGANALVDDSFVQDNSHYISNGDVFLTQIEIPFASVKKGLHSAKQKGALTILNPAPYHEKTLELLKDVDIVTPNETEFEAMTRISLTSDNLESEMLKFAKKYDTKLIITRGADGLSYTLDDKVYHQKSLSVAVADTTGAGDTFNGVLAARLAAKDNYKKAIHAAGIAASLSVTKTGAQTGMPTFKEIAPYLPRDVQ